MRHSHHWITAIALALFFLAACAQKLEPPATAAKSTAPSLPSQPPSSAFSSTTGAERAERETNLSALDLLGKHVEAPAASPPAAQLHRNSSDPGRPGEAAYRYYPP